MHRYFEINTPGHNIRCKLYCRDMTSPVTDCVVFCHGFGGHKDNGAAEKFAERITSKYKGAAMVTFNWPCHGDDVKKKLSLADCDSYLAAVLEYVRDTLGAERVYSYATSFGGYLVLKYIYDHGSPFVKTALRCPAVNMYEVITSSIMSAGDMEKLRKGKDVPVGFDRKVNVSPTFIAELREKDITKLSFLDHADDILIIHGTSDEIVPFPVSRQFAEDNVIEFRSVEGADHRFRDGKKMEEAMKMMTEWYGW